MNKETLSKLKELAQAATPGPWYQSRFMVRKDGAGVTIPVAGTSDSADSAFIATANPAAVLELIALAERATAAEAKLEAIRKGVRECVGMGFDKNGPNWISRQQVLALFQPQPQADESGLPG